MALRRGQERGYNAVDEQRAQLDVDLRSNLSGVGLWVDNGKLTPEETVREILARTRGTAGIVPPISRPTKASEAA